MSGKFYLTDSSSSDDFVPYTHKEPQQEIDKIIGINMPTIDNDVNFYVKYVNKSYKSCKWLSYRDLSQSQKGIKEYNKLLKQPYPFRRVPFLDIPLYKPTAINFDRGYITYEQILATRTIYGKTEYLVKWAALDISESTWETDVPSQLILSYNKNNQNSHPRISNLKAPRQRFIEIKYPLPYKNDHVLTSYQLEGFNWIQHCWCIHQNSILADEMGLGKTIQAIAMLDFLRQRCNISGPFLIIAPLSTIPNWMNEIEQWTDFRAVSFTGSEKCRQLIKDHLIYHRNEHGEIDTDRLIFDILIVSYETLTRELAFIKKIHYFYLIVDEAQRLKNPKSITYSSCSAIKAGHILLLTGTPVQNNITELWSLLHFIDPTNFSNCEEFEEKYKDTQNKATVEKLQEIIRPYLLRRKKGDIKELALPIKEETVIEVELTQIQKTFYKNIMEDSFNILANVSSHCKGNLNNIMMQLRKVCCHPYLIPGLETLCTAQYREMKGIPSNSQLSVDDEYKSLILASGKTILIDKLLPKLKENNHKVLIFSQMTKMLNIIEDYLVYKQYNYERLDGSRDVTTRNSSIERFKNNDDSFAFLLSTRAGGFGINLTAADTVIIYDSDWNPQNDIQAQARCHRYGQTKDVQIYRLVTRNTYESEMFLRASKKLALDYAILDSHLLSNKEKEERTNDEGTNEARSEPKDEAKELEMILRKGAYYTFMDNSDEIDKFCSENIDQILEHRSHQRKDFISGGNSLFSTVKFDSSTKDELDIEGNDFWHKLLDPMLPKSQTHLPRRFKKIHYSQEKGEEEEAEDDEANTESETDSDFIPSYSMKVKASGNQTGNQSGNASDTPRDAKQQSPIDINSNPSGNNPQDSQSQVNQQQVNQSQVNQSQVNQQQVNQSQVNQSQVNQQQVNQQQVNQSQVNQSQVNQSQVNQSQVNQSQANQQQANQQQVNQSQVNQQQANQQQVNQSQVNQQQANQQQVNQSQANRIEWCKLTFNTIIDALDTIQEVFGLIQSYGIWKFRIQKNTFKQELCKSLISIAYLRLDIAARKKFEFYISREIGDPMDQIISTPVKQFLDEDFLNNLFKNNECSILKHAMNNDVLYRAAIYISNERLPDDYQFAPEMDPPLGWTPIDDFTLITSRFFLNNIDNFYTEEKLPYHSVNPKYLPSKEWIMNRIFLISHEVVKFIPPNYSCVNKYFNPVSTFVKNNPHVIHPKILSRCFQKRLLRVLYLYGIPNTNPIQKILFIAMQPSSDKKVVGSFIYSIILRALEFKPSLKYYLKVLECNKETIDVNWIDENAIIAVAENLEILMLIRTNFLWFNNNRNLKIDKWNIQKPWWDKECDKILYNITAYYGFLLFSEIARFMPSDSLNHEMIFLWREEELRTLTPILHPKAKYLKFAFPIEARKERLKQIIQVIKTTQNTQ